MGMTEYRKFLAAEIRAARKMKSLRQYVEQEYLPAHGNAVIDIQMYEGLELFDPLSTGNRRS